MMWLYFGPTRLELKHFSMLRRSSPKMVFRVREVSKPEQILSKDGAEPEPA